MKNKILGLLMVLGLLSSTRGWSQAPSDGPGNPLRELRESLGTLNSSRIPTGTLLDRVMLMTEPARFAGRGDTAASYSGFKQQYWEFYYAALDTNRFITLDALRARINQRVEQGTVPLLMLRYNYNQLAATAAQDRLITVDSANGRVYDGPDLSRSPYTTGQFFSVALPVPTTTNTMAVYVGSEFWLGNQPNPGYLWLDFGDGVGYRQVTMGSTVQVQVPSTPAPGTQARGTAGAVTTLIVHAYEAASGYVATTGMQYMTTASIAPDVALGLVASRFWGNFRATKVPAPDGRATAIAWIKYAPSNPAVNGVRKLRRPLVFVEGIDFALRRNNSENDDDYPVNRYIAQTGYMPLSDFEGSARLRRGGYRNGLAGWNEMVDYNEEYKSLEKFPVLRQQLQVPTDPGNPANSAGGYDIIYLDFSDGASLIQHNAMVLAELLEWINKPENRTANAEETLVVAVSMGGQVARFALAWMEQQNLCHNSKLYVSFDSPHRGANVPLGIQHMFDRLQSIWFKDGPAEDVVKNQLKREATMQMVNFHFSNLSPGYRRDWQAWQNSPGSYPSLLRKVAVANGSGQAVFQPGMTPGMEMLRMQYKFVSASREVAGPNHAYALPGISTRGKNNVVFRYKKAYFAAISGWKYSYADPAWGHFDTAPGSTSRVAEEADKKSGPLKAVHPSNTFMATLSALDVKDAGSFNSPNFGYNVQQQIPVKDRPNRAKYAFDAYFVADDKNEPHVQITNAQASQQGNDPYVTNNSAWIQNELRESTHLMPAVLTYNYNYGSPYRHLLPSVQVNAGAELYVNHRTRPIGGGDERYAKTPSVAGTFEAYTSNCATIVQINSGGLLGVGTPGSITSSFPASLRMSANSLLDVRASGRVDVNAGSVLRIPAGATLVVRSGATLNVYGQLIVETGAYLCVENTANIVTSGAGTYTVQPGVNHFAKSSFTLGTLACAQPTATPLKATTSGVMTSNCTTGYPSYRPNQAQWTVTPTGGIGTYSYKWWIDYGTGRGYEGPYSTGTTFSRCLNEGQYSVATVKVVVTSGTQQVTVIDYAQSQYGARLMYPNPADTYVEIGDAEDLVPADQKKEHKYKPMKIKAHNGQGKEVFTADDVTSATLRVDIRNWPTGLYQILIERDGKATRHQLSVQH